MDIVKQLSLHQNPQAYPNGSLSFAENIKLSKDSGLTADDSLVSAFLTKEDTVIDWCGVDHSDDKFKVQLYGDLEILGKIECPTELIIFCRNKSSIQNSEGDEIVAYINYIKRCSEVITTTGKKLYVKDIFCNWTYYGGDIIGTYYYNVNNELIISFSEINTDADVPLRFINLDIVTSSTSEESFTTAPQVPICNCVLAGKNIGSPVPNGVYQFFIQYEIDHDEYTDWFPIGIPYYALKREEKVLFNDLSTNIRVSNVNTGDGIVTPYQGKPTVYKVKVNNINKDSDENFVLSLTFDNFYTYKNYRIGYILQHDDAVVARIWKKFPYTQTTVIFDGKYTEETDINTIISNPMEIKNVNAITNFNNRLYIGNFKEEDDIDFRDYITSDLKSCVDVDYVDANTKKETVSQKVFKITEDSNVELKPGVPYSLSDLLEHEEFIEAFKNIRIVQKEDNGVSEDSIKNWSYAPNKNFIEWAYDKDDFNSITANNVFISITYGGSVLASTNKDYNGWFYNVSSLFAYTRTDGSDGTSAYISDGRLYRYHEFNLNKLQLIAVEPTITTELETKDRCLNYLDTYAIYIHFVKSNGKVSEGYYLKQITPNFDVYEFDIDNPKLPKLKFDLDKIKIPNGYIGVTFSYAIVHNASKYYGVIVDKTDGDNITLFIASTELRANIIAPNATKIKVFYKDKVFTTDAIGDYNISSYRHLIGNMFVEAGKDTFGYPDALLVDIPKSDGIYLDNIIKGTKVLLYDDVEPYFDKSEVKELTFFGPIYYKGFNDFVNCDFNYPAYWTEEDVYFFNKRLLMSDGFDYKVLEVNKDTNNYDYCDRGAVDKPINDVIYRKIEPYIESYNYNKISNFNLAAIHIEREPDNIVFNISADVSGKDVDVPVMATVVLPQNSIDTFALSEAFKEKNYKIALSYDPFKRDTDYSNIIRRSYVVGDESPRTDWRKFDANDYKVIPNQYGNITNLVVAGQMLVIHTEYTIYAISSESILQETNNNSVQVSNPDIFNVPVTQLIPGTAAFGGLQNYKAWTMNYKGYWFFDKRAKKLINFDSRTIDDLGIDIDDYIQKNNIEDIAMTTDYNNNRILMCFKFGEDKYTTFSIDLNTRKFISLHDYKYDLAGATRNNCYIFSKGDLYTFLDDANANYPTELYNNPFRFDNTADANQSIVDIIFNQQYEQAKVINAIQYVLETLDRNKNTWSLVYEENAKFAGNAIRVYTDVCDSGVVDIRVNQDDKDRFNLKPYNAPDAYRLPWYEKGIWHFNYFRNAKRKPQRPELPVYRDSDDQTLMYGKYFVVRFVFDNKDANNAHGFVLRNINVNLNVY